ncbi:MAG: amidase [Desulfobulbaceae bacterium]|nr:amidase [Desulfobulbaceae bacterium]
MKKTISLVFLLAIAACTAPPPDIEEATIADLHDRMQRGELTAEQLVSSYLERIEAIDRNGPQLNSIIEINPDALLTARSLDEEWQESGPRGPMHGIPVVLKANIGTADQMQTTAGSLALANHRPDTDAFLVSRLRDAGAIILGKANLSEWANFRSSRSSSGWSSIGGQTKNPYDTARNPCGSSSGSAVSVAANLTVVAIGTETDGSVICPSGINGIVGIKPTLGLVSRSGIIPLAHSQDTAGPMARSVRDAAILLGAMTGIDAEDPVTQNGQETVSDYTANLAADGLAGKRIGVIRSYHGAGSHAEVEAIFEAAIESLRAQGAEIVDSIEIDTTGVDDAESTVLYYEFKADLKHYLEQTGAPLSSLAEIIEFNENNKETVMPFFGQERMLSSEEKGPLTDEEYLAALETSKRVSQQGIDDVMAEHDLDALIAPSNGPAWMTDHVNGDSFHVGSSSYAAVSGYPNITVPAGFISGLPVGVSFIGRPFSEKLLIEIAYAFEQATSIRQPPEL